MKKLYTLLAGTALLLAGNVATAQYATSGKGKYVNRVFWLNWQHQTNADGTGLVSVTNSSGQDITSTYNAGNTTLQAGTYTWELVPGALRVIGKVSNLDIKNGGKLVTHDITNDSWATAFKSLYGGLNTVTLNGNKTTFDISLAVQFSADGGNSWNQQAYPGMVVGDAEQLSSTEDLSATASSLNAWEELEYSGSSTTYNINISNKRSTSTAKFTDPDGGSNNYGSAILFARNATSLTNITLNSNSTGLQSLALGLVLSVDHGDAPLSYGDASQCLTYFGTAEPLNTGNQKGVSSTRSLVSETETTDIYLGAATPDADAAAFYSEKADGDNLNGLNDEDGVITTGLDVNSTALAITANNSSAAAATVYGWLDKDQDGSFAGDDLVIAAGGNVAAGSTNKTLTATLSGLKAGYYYARFRIGKAAGGNTTAVNSAINGEVEDYKIHIAGYTVNGTVVKDQDGVTGGITGTGTGKAGDAPLYVYQVNEKGEIVSRQPVGADGNYTVTDINTGDKLYVSSNSAATSLSELTLPGNWRNSGEENSDATVTNNGFAAVFITPGTPVSEAFTAKSALTQNSNDLAVTIDVSGPVTAGEGSELQVAVVNNGPDATSTATTTTLTQTLPTGFTFSGTPGDQGNGWVVAVNGQDLTATYTGGPVANGDAFPQLVIPVAVDPSMGGQTLVNTIVLSNGDDPDLSDNTATKSVLVNSNTTTAVRLSSFTGIRQNGINQLTWTTATEINNKGFELQRSLDNGHSWSDIVFKAGVGTSTSRQNYSAVDPSAATYETALYRLVQFDLDGTRQILNKTVSISASALAAGIRLYPNPAHSKITVSGLKAGARGIISNGAGQVVARFNAATATQIVNINGLAAGVYYLKVTTGAGSSRTATFIVQ